MPQSQQPHYNQVTSPSFIWKGLRFQILHGTPWWPEEKSWLSPQVLRWFSVPERDFSEEMGFPPWNHSFFTVFFSFLFAHSLTQLWLWPVCATPCPSFWGCPSEWNPWHTCPSLGLWWAVTQQTDEICKLEIFTSAREKHQTQQRLAKKVKDGGTWAERLWGGGY